MTAPTNEDLSRILDDAHDALVALVHAEASAPCEICDAEDAERRAAELRPLEAAE